MIIPDDLQAVLRALARRGRPFLVGGCVRDSLLGLEPKDFDVEVFGLDWEQLAAILAPIEDSEGAYGGELMRSLEAFIECNGQWERAAKALFCHRHTLRYRIRRVEELTGRSLDSARDRIDFWLALRGRELVQTERN